jgi:bacterioferritin (cytochrome b1)
VSHLCRADDRGTADLLLDNLRQEERHPDYLEPHLRLIKELGLANYSVQELEEPTS